MSYTDILKPIYSQWLVAKQQAEADYYAAGKPEIARRYHDCEMFAGDEDLPALCEKLLTMRGLEFCIGRRFPTLDTFRLFKSMSPEKYGVYIDAGETTLCNPRKVLLVGNTDATLIYDGTDRHKIALMHGAKATLHASGHAVVKIIATDDSAVEKHIFNNAIVL